MFYFSLDNVAYLNITGEDRFSFLQHQTTNDVASLVPGQILNTILTSPEGRILDISTFLASRLG